MYTFQLSIDPTLHDEFIKKSPFASLLQSSSWAVVKNNWGNERIGVFEGDNLVATASVLIRRLPLGWSMLYIPRGPIMDYTNKDLVRFFMKKLKEYGRTKRALFIKMDPAIMYRSALLEETAPINPQATEQIAFLESLGAKWHGLTIDLKATIQPRFQANVYQEDFLEENFTKKTRQMLRIARKKGVHLEIGQAEFLPAFQKLMYLTEERKNVKLRSSNQGDYYKKLLETYPNDAFILLATLNLQELRQKTDSQLETIKKEYENLKENQVKKRHMLAEQQLSLAREKEELTQSIARFGEIVPIAGTLSIVFGATSEVLYAGMDEQYKRYMPAYLTWFETIQECFKRGAKTSNLGGLDGSLNDGLLKFKKSFNPHIEEFIGEFDLPVNKGLFHLSELAYRLKMKK